MEVVAVTFTADMIFWVFGLSIHAIFDWPLFYALY